jgi:hypothetical protein
MHHRDVLGVPRPLMDDPPPGGGAPGGGGGGGGGAPAAPPAAAATQLFYPVRDLTRLPDRPDPGLIGGLRGRYMGSPLAYMQVLPNHVEVSYQALSSIMLWPPMEIFHPFHIDYELAVGRLGKPARARAARSGTRRRRRQRRPVVSNRAIGLPPPSS